ncbi:putative phage head-tail adaptor [Ostertagia ostertagi]
MPKLNETPAKTNDFSYLKPLPQAENNFSDRFTAKADEQPATPPSVFNIVEEKEAAPLQVVIKEETKENEQQTFQYGDHRLSNEELEEKRRFEEQKRMLEERAERLRKLSFNIKGNDGGDDLENVPAYMRRNVNLDNSGSSDTYYSGYSIGVNDQQKNNQAAIQTINTFLDGKKPD